MECKHSTINAARANFARYHGIPLARVSLKDVVNASGGVAAWLEEIPSSAPVVASVTAAAPLIEGRAALPPLPCQPPSVTPVPCQPPSVAPAPPAAADRGEQAAAPKDRSADSAAPAPAPAQAQAPAPEGRLALPLPLPPLPLRPPTEAAAAVVEKAPLALPGNGVPTANAAAANNAAAGGAGQGKPGGAKQVAFRPPLGDITNAAKEPQKLNLPARPDATAAPRSALAALPTPSRALLRNRPKRVPLEDITNSGIIQETKVEAPLATEQLHKLPAPTTEKEQEQEEEEKKEEEKSKAEADKKADEACPRGDPLPEDVLLAEYGLREMRHMAQREADGAPRPDYMKGQPDVNGEMRAILNDWLVDVHRKFEHRKESLFLAVQVLDRYLAIAKVKRNRLQLVGATSALVAAKFEEVEPMEVPDLIYVTDKAYSKDEFVDMEGSILRALGFKLAAPTAAHFLRHLHSALRKKSLVPVEGEEPRQEDPIHPELMDSQPVKRNDSPSEQLSWFILELSLLDVRFLNRAPSSLAAASVLLSNRLLGEAEPWPMLLEQLSGYSEASLSEPCDELHRLLQAAPNSPFTGVRRRYPQVKALGLRRLPAAAAAASS